MSTPSSSSARLFQAAATLSAALRAQNIGHAFHGGLLTVLLGSPRPSEELYCIVEGSPNTHPFRRVRQALAGNEVLTATLVGWSNRLYIKYHEPIPAIEFEVLPAGEEGPRRLDASRVMQVHNVPFLNVTEFVRAKMKAWVSRRSQEDAEHVIFVMARFWAQVDINRIQEDDMDRFVAAYPAASAVWTAIKRRYGM
ncbi:hypothetical protein M422DRAFT_188713 [Sphaerobolus stellatus SS14]|uniref:Uncharacterized protein n=1 Tax=Sphaerobolus stellatus (strain SS14) TaxID=990650 RepID=A0A0C9UVQ3_SPHS4|nr:hypothetical protein M422DRAFT_188713 [Sphaerobolus stellatus SS14]